MSNGDLLEYEDELLAALEQIKEEPDKELRNEPYTITRPEAHKQLGLSKQKTKKLLNMLCDAGKLKRVMIRRVTAWNYVTSVQGYKLVRRENQKATQ